MNTLLKPPEEKEAAVSKTSLVASSQKGSVAPTEVTSLYETLAVV